MADKTDKSPLESFAGEMLPGKPQNLYGLEPEDIKKYKTTQEDLIKALENRYSQPNYFKIAAGFAKPQLGGFLASLGSASEAMGENIEQQRAMQLPIYKAKSELAAYEAGLKQKGKASDILSDIVGKQGGIGTPGQIADIGGLTGGPQTGASAGQETQQARAAQLRGALETGMTYADLVKNLGQPFVDQNLASVLRDNPSLVPQGTPNSILDTLKPKTPITPVINPSTIDENAIPGVPTSLLKNMTRGQEIETANNQIAARLERVKDLNTKLGSLAQLSAPIFEATKSLYLLAAKPSLKPAFALLEKNGPMSIIGKAMEDQTVSSVLANMRQQILNTKFASTEEKDAALSDFGSFINALGSLNTSLVSSFPNPTDARSFIEQASVPTIKNTQDAFLRGIASLGSEALSKHEIKTAFDDYLKPGTDVYKWESSAHYRQALKNAQKRHSELISTPASTQLPRFMKEGLKGTFALEAEGDQSSPAKPAATSAAQPAASNAQPPATQSLRDYVINRIKNKEPKAATP